MLKLLQKLLNWRPFGAGHGAVPKTEAPVVSQPHAPGFSIPMAGEIKATADAIKTAADEIERIAAEPVLTSITSNGKFPAAIIQAAIDAASAHGPYIWPSVSLAQWALESNYGKSMPVGSNNPFGIKAVGDQPAVSATTWEVEGGKKVIKKQSFRKFASQTEAFSLHNKLLATSKYYKKARATKNAVEFAKALTGVYATDPDYDKKLRTIMDACNLYQYDNPPK